jgi:nitrous-oxide reductase
VSVPKNPHGVNASPDGKYFICAGKLSPTTTDHRAGQGAGLVRRQDGEARRRHRRRGRSGPGPLHTAFDGRGNAFTTLFLDSQIVKWNIEKAIAFHKGDKNAKYVVDRIDVHYQPGHINASQSETKAADGKFLAVGCKFSKDRFLPVGPLHPENEQLIDISWREDGAAGRPPGAWRAARLHHLQARSHQDPSRSAMLDATRWPSRIPRNLACSATARRSRSR